MKFVAVYEVWSEYGGHEEGGWFYDSGIPSIKYKHLTRSFGPALLVAYYVPEEKAYEYKKFIEELLVNNGEKLWHGGSVGGAGDTYDMSKGDSVQRDDTYYEVRITNGKPKRFPKVKPHYE
jgi:hypothetical protein